MCPGPKLNELPSLNQYLNAKINNLVLSGSSITFNYKTVKIFTYVNSFLIIKKKNTDIKLAHQKM